MIRSNSWVRRTFGRALPLALATLVAAGPAATSGQAPGALQPSLEGGVGWINTAGPIRLADLKGKIVLLDFWTYCCINCHHILPDLAKLEAKYPNELVVIGVHTAKFDAERVTENIRKKVREYRIEHPVVNDADQVIWNRFGVNAWPTLFLLDATGKPVGYVSGEGHYDLLDRVIGDLVKKHREAGELDETPLMFFPEKDRPHEGALLFPGKVLADPAGNRLFIADTGHNRIVVTDLQGKGLATIGSGEVGFTSGSYERATFNRPQGMCLVGETLYVADTENHAIRAVDLGKQEVRTVAGTGVQSTRRAALVEGTRARKGNVVPGPVRTAPIGPGETTALSSPWDVLQIPGTPILAIAMAGPHQIWTYDTANDVVALFAGSGRETITDGSPAEADFAQPSGLATDGKTLFVADSEVSGVRTIELSPPHRVGRVVGVGLFDYGDVDGQGAEVRLQHCLGLAYADGKLYIADTYNNKVKVADPKARAVETFAGTGNPGEADDPAAFHEPGGLSVAGDVLYVADTNNHAIRKVDRAGGSVSTVSIAGIEPPVRKPRPPSFPNAQVVRADPAEVAPARTFDLKVDLPIPADFKLTPDVPLSFLLETPGREGVIVPEMTAAGGKIEPAEPTFAVPVPLTADPEPGSELTLKLSVSAVICREGNAGVCIPKSYVWEIPIRFADGGKPAVELSVPQP